MPNTPIIIEEKHDKKETWKAVTGFIVVGLMFFGIYVWITGWQLTLHQLGLRGTVGLPTIPTRHQIPLQEVKNLGYDFYLGEIDSPNNTSVSDTLKNQITKIVSDAHVSADILKNTPVIILNNLALTGDQYVSVSGWNLKVPDLKADWLSEGGIYVTFDGGSSVIFINKPIIAQGQLTEVLSHEFGHAVGNKLTDQEWFKYYQLRNISTDTVRHGTNWNLSPEEDFAEVYKYTFTNIAIRTQYGPLISPLENVNSFERTYAQIVAEKEARASQIRAALFPNSTSTKYSIDQIYTVNQATKDFIVSIMNRLNQ